MRIVHRITVLALLICSVALAPIAADPVGSYTWSLSYDGQMFNGWMGVTKSGDSYEAKLTIGADTMASTFASFKDDTFICQFPTPYGKAEYLVRYHSADSVSGEWSLLDGDAAGIGGPLSIKRAK